VAPKTTVFIDYQNAHQSGHHRYCSAHEPIYECLLDPAKLAERVVAKRAPGGEITDIRVYRGKPEPRKEPKLASANDKHFNAWMTDYRVTMKRRMLMYPDGWGEPGCFERPREKGIDVSIAIDMVRLAFEQKYEVGILFSRDTDLLPAIEMVRDLKLAHVEVAGWDGASRLRLPGLWYHELDEADFRAVRNTRHYDVR
jgi:uncharacterized LabA/DUF88 family protein